ncbi:MAG: hypothetical protein H7Y20_18880 [Bryobacteraceae bacterium]|nr:hypothetical protein [Bryobacteraceae bacterium]
MKLKAALLAVVVVSALLLFAWTRRSVPGNEAERNRVFTDSMSGVTLVGYSSRLTRTPPTEVANDSRRTPFCACSSSEERYHIDGVSHLSGNTWLFRTRLKHDGREIPVPIPLTVEWAGDTPVITLTDLAIPGVGTYTARVVLYRDQYAGTWSGRNIGGQLFGKIERLARP